MLVDDRIETVSQLTRRIKDALEGGFQGVWVRGEISNFRRQSSGHSYFSLKDEGSQLSAVLFRGDSLRQAQQPRDGMQVVAYGDLSVYEPRGNYQMIVRMIMDDGMGRLRQEFERLKAELAAEGLFAAERKQPLPPMPLTVGFITSPTGAAIQDFIRILQRRQWRGRLVVLPVKVQGTEAAGEMASMLRTAERMGIFDLLVIGRGGGSLEDLWAFNEETLVRAVAACSLPVISAVGHEIDFTLVDFAADRRAETPSAAAELISSAFVSCGERWEAARRSLRLRAETLLADSRRSLTDCGSRLRLLSPLQKVERHWLKLDDLGNRLHGQARTGWRERSSLLQRCRGDLERHAPTQRLNWHRQELMQWIGRFNRSFLSAWKAKQDRVARLERGLRSLSPDSVLHRGFVLLRDAKGQVVPRKAETRPGQCLRAVFADGEIAVTREKDPA